jgi:hypothetical protein
MRKDLHYFYDNYCEWYLDYVRYIVEDEEPDAVYDLHEMIRKLLVLFRLLSFSAPEFELNDLTNNLQLVLNATEKLRYSSIAYNFILDFYVKNKKLHSDQLIKSLILERNKAMKEVIIFFQNNSQYDFFDESIYVLLEGKIKKKDIQNFLLTLEFPIYDAWKKPRTIKQLCTIHKINQDYRYGAKHYYVRFAPLSKFSAWDRDLSKWFDLQITIKIVKKSCRKMACKR